MINNLQRKKAKQKTILNAATKLFFVNGYKKTSIAQIAKEANSSQVTLYKYYASKVELARAVVVKLIVEGYGQYDKLLDDPDKTFVEKMQAMMQTGSSEASQISDNFVSFMLKEFRGANGSRTVLKVYNDYKINFWNKLFDQGRQEGKVNPQISNEAALIFLDMYVSYALNPNYDAVEFNHHADELIHLFYYGIMGR
ncbi:TetR/AcrR family transcriptional regulator [Companilactobacillus suantsaicola]|uniref:TetR/AcrR family transcriptional regulator n=1 Tax=Companilactobacillus suantsaicola TaxID=2487723 RepID=A0A4Z0JFP1_9LACO|nr:TetR/AcrR family transcriptional regulator [Companilactobacillus suantsaicola]TGD21636.1 TetR/AcrR family transcriptional regulator [Companilactobacillus suantsaicola]